MQALAAMAWLTMEGGGDVVPAGEGEGDNAFRLLTDMLQEQGNEDHVPLIFTEGAGQPSTFDAHLPGGVPPAAHPSGLLHGTGAEGLDELMEAPAGGSFPIKQEALSFGAEYDLPELSVAEPMPAGMLSIPDVSAIGGEEEEGQGDASLATEVPLAQPYMLQQPHRPEKLLADSDDVFLESMIESLVEDSVEAGEWVLPAVSRQKVGRFWTDEVGDFRSGSEDRKGVFMFLPQRMITPLSRRSSSFKLHVKGILMAILKPFKKTS